MLDLNKTTTFAQISKMNLWVLKTPDGFNTFCPIYKPTVVALVDFANDNSLENQLLAKMLQVLDKSQKRILMARVNADDLIKKRQDILKQIVNREGQTVLIFGEALAQVVLHQNVDFNILRKAFWKLPDNKMLFKITYHPRFLLLAPEHKKEAYQDLLELRTRLIV